MFAHARFAFVRALVVAGLLAVTSFRAAGEEPALLFQKDRIEPQPSLIQNYGKLPLAFEANAGQANGNVLFLARGNGYGLYLSGEGAVLRVGCRMGSAPCGELRMQMDGARDNATPAGEVRLAGTANYFVGRDPAGWRTNIPTYARVRMAQVYSGIDVVYYGDQGRLEYDFAVAPHADAGEIRMRFGGAKQIQIAANGDLGLRVGRETVAFRKPLVYQMVEGRRRTIEGEFSLLGKHTVGFRLGHYDHARELVIDPVLEYSTYLGGSSGNAANAIAIDATGDAYVTGSTNSSDFPLTGGAYQSKNKGAATNSSTVFVSKLNRAGTGLVYSTYIGGSGGDIANGIAIDGSGNAYVTGITYSIDFPVTQGAFQTTNKVAANGVSIGYNSTVFVTKLNATGTALTYSTYLGGSGGKGSGSVLFGDRGSGVAVDNLGNAYVTGITYSPDFPVTQGAYKTTNSGQAAFVSKVNATGTGLVYSTYVGSVGEGQGWAAPTALALDSAGNAYVTGGTSATDFPVTAGAFQTTNHNSAVNGLEGSNAFASELNATGTGVIYSTYLGGSGDDAGDAITVDAAGDAYIGGSAESTDFPVTPGAFQSKNRFGFGNSSGPNASVGPNAFVVKMNPMGTALLYSTYLGGSGGLVNVSPTLMMAGGDGVKGIAIDSAGDAYVTGSTASPNFPVTAGAYQTTNNDQTAQSIGGYNAFVSEVNQTGTALVYSTYLGGDGINQDGFTGLIEFGEGDQANGLALDSTGNVFVAGSASSADFPVTGGAFETGITSGEDAFVAKLDIGAISTTITPAVAVTPTPATITSAKPLMVTIAVSGGSGAATPTGTVTLASGTYNSGAITLNGGSAAVNIPPGVLAAYSCYPAPVSDLLTVNYVPDAASASTYNFASGDGLAYVVGACITATSSPAKLTWAQSQSEAAGVAITAAGATGDPLPTGNVTLTTGSYTSAVTALSGGAASFSIPAGTLTTGFNLLNVSYGGDSNYTALPLAGSALVTVGGVTVTVTPAATSITTAQSLKVGVTVSSGAGNPTATGTVTLLTAGSYTASAQLADGSATITIPASSLPVGVDPLNVSYGSGNYGGASGSASVTVTSAASPSFTIAGTAVTVTAGASTGNTSTITVTPAGGFTGIVALTAALSPTTAEPPTLSFGSTTPVSITGAAAGTATLTITTYGQTPVCTAMRQDQPKLPWYAEGGAVLACGVLFGIPARRRKWRALLAGMVLLVALSGGVTACGSGGHACPAVVGPPATTTGTYTVTVTGTSGGETAVGMFTLIVQ